MTKLVIRSSADDAKSPDPNLIELIARAHRWLDDLATGKMPSVREIARRDRLDEGDVSRFLPLAFLAPDIVEAILFGKQPVELTAERLKRIGSLPYAWEDQRRLLDSGPKSLPKCISWFGGENGCQRRMPGCRPKPPSTPSLGVR